MVLGGNEVKEFLTLHEAATYIGRNYGTIYSWVVEGKIEHKERKKGSKRFYRIPLSEANRIKETLERGLWV